MWKDWWEKYDGFDFYIKSSGMEKYLLEVLNVPTVYLKYKKNR